VGCTKQIRRFKGPAVVICNHRWWPDSAFVAFFFFWRRLYSVIAAEVMGEGFSGWIMGNVLCIPVKRGELDLGCYKSCIEALSRGKMVIILPEGKINTTLQPLLPFKSGAALIALNARVPILPMATDGVFAPFRRLNVAFGAPIDPVEATAGLGGVSQKVAQLTALMEREVHSLYDTLYSRMTPRQKVRVERYHQKNLQFLADKNHMTAEEYEARITERNR
jgi:1-acyl-sn-glycerol-3-phosphate acyltransferase